MKLNFKMLFVIMLAFSSNLFAFELHPFFKSVILPGWGELSQKNNSGYFFLSAELISWSTYFYFLEEADLNEKAAYNLAVRYAGIPIESDYPEDYFYNLKRYDNSNLEENNYLLEKAQEEYPNDISLQTDFIDKYSWDWEIDKKRFEYGEHRTNIISYEDYARTVTAAFILNRMISGLNALRINRKLKRFSANMQLNSDLQPLLFLKYSF